MPILKTRTPFKQIAADGKMYDAKGAEILEAKAAGTAVNYLGIANANTGRGPSVSAEGTDDDVSLVLAFKGNGAVSIADDAEAAPGKLELVSSDRLGGLSFTFIDDSSHSSYTLSYPATAPGGDAFVKVDASGNISYSTGSASSFDIVADTGSSQTINSGDSIVFAGTAEQIDTAVGATDTITLSLPNVVSITTALKVPAIQAANGSAALTIANGGGLTAAKSLTVSNDLTVTGNLTVNGSTTTVESSTLTVNDATITIADGATSTAANNAGIYVAGSAGGENAYAFLKWDSADKWVSSADIESNGTSINIADGDGQYKVNGRKLVDFTGAYFYGDDSVGSGLKVDGNNKVRLDIKNENTDVFAATETSAASVSVVRIAPSNALNLDHVQVFLNGILQRNTDTVTNNSAYANLSAGDFDCVVRNGTGGIDFLQGVVESADLVSLYYSI